MFKKSIKWFFILFIVLNGIIIISGKAYLYKAVANTYLKGRNGPSISEYEIFENAKIGNGKAQEWPIGKDYNSRKIPDTLETKMNFYNTVAFVIIKNDSVRHEQYWDGFSSNSISNSFSMAKTFVSILVGIAIDEGKIKSVDEPVGDFLPEFNNTGLSRLTIKHLLTMSSGINFDENYVNPLAYPAAAYYGNDIKKLTLTYALTKEPGKAFEYLSGNTEILGFILEKATGKSISQYASEKLWKPLGAKNPAYWSLDHKGGIEKAYCCFNSNALDFARIGELFLHNGNWKGQQLVSKEYVNASIHPANITNEDGGKNEKYGYSWWLMNYKNHEIFYARGIQGQYILVIPDKKMVVVRLGHKRSKHSTNGHPDDVYNYLDAALDMDGD